jgi:hypothetical protein
MPTLSRIRSGVTSSGVPGDRGVRHPAGVLDQRLDAAQRLAQREHLRPVADVDRVLLATGDPERHDAAVPAHLLGGGLVAGMARHAGVQHGADAAVALQELDDLLRVVAVPLHPDPERLDPAQYEPGVERPATAPIAFWWKAIRSASSASRTISAPPTTSE